MRPYKSGKWGFALVWGLRASVFPQAFALALPNAVIAWTLAALQRQTEHDEEIAKNAVLLQAAFTSVLFWVLYFRSTVAYNRWWEGGTLLQQTRGEWFNAYSSLIAFSSTDPKMAHAVEAYHHQLARFMSLLFCSALQQVSPDPERPFEVIDGYGLDPESLQFLSQSSDRVEVILQWIQRSTIVNMSTGLLPIPPPVMSRAFQEISRGIVNLQNARKIADFPFPFPYAQTSIVMLLVHWAVSPIISSLMLNRWMAAGTSFASIFFLWCMNYTALQLESPFGSEANDLPMDQMQSDWNKSVGTLLANRAQYPPTFQFDAQMHRRLNLRMSDGSQSLKKRMTVGKLLESAAAKDKDSTSTESKTVGRSTSTSDFRVDDVGKSVQMGTVLLDRSVVLCARSESNGSPGFSSEHQRPQFASGEAMPHPPSPSAAWQPLPSTASRVLAASNGRDLGSGGGNYSLDVSEERNSATGPFAQTLGRAKGREEDASTYNSLSSLNDGKPLPAALESAQELQAPRGGNTSRELSPDFLLDFDHARSGSSISPQVAQERVANEDASQSPVTSSQQRLMQFNIAAANASASRARRGGAAPTGPMRNLNV